MHSTHYVPLKYKVAVDGVAAPGERKHHLVVQGKGFPLYILRGN